MQDTRQHRQQPSRISAGRRIGPFSVLSRVDQRSLDLGQMLPSGEVRSRRFTKEANARAGANRLGEGWEAWTAPGASAWFVRRRPQSSDVLPAAGVIYTVLGPTDEVLARYVAADAVPALVGRARGNVSVFDDRDGNRVLAATEGNRATLAMLDGYEATHVVARHVVAYFADSNNPGRALTLTQLDYDPAKNYLDPRDARAIEALAPGASHQPIVGDPEEGPLYGIVTRVSAAVHPKALARSGVVLGVGFDEAEARADAAERSPTDAEAADVEVVDATLAALSGWHDDELRERVYLAAGPDRRIDVFDVLPETEPIVRLTNRSKEK